MNPRIALATQEPDLVAWLLTNVFHVRVPEYHHGRAQGTDVRVLVPRTYRADGVVLFCDEEDRPLLAVILEVQRNRDMMKRRTWKLYVAQLEAELNVDAALVIFVPDAALAEWYRDLLESDGSSLPLRPFILTPDDVPLVKDVDVAQANPALTILSAIWRGDQADVDGMFPAVLAALRAFGPLKANLYHDIVLAGLPEATRTRWETFMSTSANYQYRSELYRRLAAEAEARGEGNAVLTVLEARGVVVPREVSEKILACTDRERLDTWLRRAITATSADDVIGE